VGGTGITDGIMDGIMVIIVVGGGEHLLKENLYYFKINKITLINQRFKKIK